jgi:hypothetical protein
MQDAIAHGAPIGFRKLHAGYAAPIPNDAAAVDRRIEQREA